MPVQGLDIILIVIMIFSGFLAMLRGVTREMLSIMSWALAAVATLLAYSNLREEVRSFIGPKALADGLLLVTVFILGLLVFSLVTINISERVLDSKVGAVDRTLGFVYGLVRGLLLVSIAYLIVLQFVAMPAWVTNARSLPLIESTANAIKSISPDNPDSWVAALLKGGSTPSSPPPSEIDRN